MTPTSPTFNELVDWIDGRLEEAAAADMASRVAASGPDVIDTVSWIRSFREAAATMPLQKPPEDVSARIRAAFRELRGPMSGPVDELELEFDSRMSPIAGVRSTGHTESFHLDFGSEDLSISLDVSPHTEGDLLVRGTVSGEGRDTNIDRPLEDDLGLVFTSSGETQRTTRLDRNGGFTVQVPADVNEVWVLSATRRARATLQ